MFFLSCAKNIWFCFESLLKTLLIYFRLFHMHVFWMQANWSSFRPIIVFGICVFSPAYHKYAWKSRENVEIFMLSLCVCVCDCFIYGIRKTYSLKVRADVVIRQNLAKRATHLLSFFRFHFCTLQWHNWTKVPHWKVYEIKRVFAATFFHSMYK